MIQATVGFATDEGKPGAWDEVYYTSHSTPEDARTAWQGNDQVVLNPTRNSILGRRRQCLATDCYVYYIRYSEVGVRGASLLSQGKMFGTFGSENMASDALVFRATSASRRTKREIRLGGLPDSVVKDGDVVSSFVSSYVGSFPGPKGGTFMGALVDNGAQIFYRTTTIGGDSSANIVGLAKPTQYGLVTLTLDKAVSWNMDRKVVLTCRGQPQLRGDWRIATFANPSGGPYTLTLAGSERVSGPTNFSGQLTDKQMDGVNLVEWGAPFLSPHKLGKKKFQRRGRQSAKLVRH